MKKEEDYKKEKTKRQLNTDLKEQQKSPESAVPHQGSSHLGAAFAHAQITTTTPVILCHCAGPDHPCVPSAPAGQDGGGHVVVGEGHPQISAVARSLPPQTSPVPPSIPRTRI